MINKLIERQASLRTNQDIRRIADKGGGAADIRREDLCKQKWVGRYFQRTTNRQGHRNNQQNGGDIIEKGGHHRGGDLQDKKDTGRVCARRLRRQYRKTLEHSGTARD